MPPTAPDIKRHFWGRTRFTETGCIEWTGFRVPKGYGKLSYKCKRFLAHRFAYWLTHGELPNDRQVLHSCDNPPCVNPSHLRLGTHEDNMADKVARDRVFRRLNVEQAEQVRRLLDEGLTMAEIARRFGMSTTPIIRIRDTIGTVQIDRQEESDE